MWGLVTWMQPVHTLVEQKPVISLLPCRIHFAVHEQARLPGSE
jgi:hypothetical protein